MPRTKPCPICEGGGVCFECNGQGFTSSTFRPSYETCDRCNGTGDCPACDGSGRVPVTQPKYTATRKGQHVEVSMEYRR